MEMGAVALMLQVSGLAQLRGTCFPTTVGQA